MVPHRRRQGHRLGGGAHEGGRAYACRDARWQGSRWREAHRPRINLLRHVGRPLRRRAREETEQVLAARRHLDAPLCFPMWAELDATAITRSDVRAMLGKINGPVLANQVLASASAVFAWATRQEILTNNPCRGVERHGTVSRERVLSDAEVPLFWQAFGEAGLAGTALQCCC